MTQDKPDPRPAFEAEKAKRIRSYADQREWKQASTDWMAQAFASKYMYNFAWMGRPIIQTPVDMVAMQDLIWTIKPDLIVETGIAHGGSLTMSASMLALLDYCDAVGQGIPLDPKATRRHVLGVDIDIRQHNLAAIQAHPMAHHIRMIQGSSVSEETIVQVRTQAQGYHRILVCLDSNHTHEHVLAELEAYAPLTSAGSYCVVFDTIVDDLPDDAFPDRPWKPGNNPKTAVREYLRLLATENRTAADGKRLTLEVDHTLEQKLMLSVAPEGYLRRS